MLTSLIVVADQAFMTKESARFPTLSSQSWSNETLAETANRLFKNQVKVMLQSAPASLRAVSYRELLREASLRAKCP